MENNLKEKKTKKYPKWFYLILLFIPIAFIIILEIVLQVLDYGTDYSTFIKISDRFENYKFFNPNLPQKYFGNLPNRPSVIPDGFKKVKSENTFRVFALGGSTTAGFPHPPNGSFPRLLKGFLSWNYPTINFEVINLGVSAINSITLRDIIDDVLQESPDLIVIYAGHNEYYGALGPSSNVSGFESLQMTRIILYLKKFRTVQFLENLIGSLLSLFTERSYESKTLMGEMAGNNLVPFNSDDFFGGVDQFESNLDYILSRCYEENVEVLIGTLASNLVQAPLCKYSGCDSLANEFESVLKAKDESRKYRLYDIKDKDELRFRAPETFNDIILSKAKKYNFTSFDVKEKFEENSPEQIIGSNLMLDHLHPTFNGNRLIAELLCKIITNKGFLDSTNYENTISGNVSLTYPEYFAYSSLDSSYATLKIDYLKNMFPFSPNIKSVIIPLSNQKTFIDSLAWRIINRKVSWEDAHLNLANFYFARNEFEKFTEEINILIEDKPFDKFPYLEAIRSLEKLNQNELVRYILLKYYNIFPDLFASRKLADLYFEDKNHRKAIFFYNKCLEFELSDPKIYFNLSASYYGIKNLSLSIETISKCLELSPNYPNAKKIYDGLISIYKSHKR